MQLYPEIIDYLENAENEINGILPGRKNVLDLLVSFLQENIKLGSPSSLLFICTHNSRRSHMAQLLAAASIAYYGLKGITTYSGGTEVTSFNTNAIKALKNAGFKIESQEKGDNPVYEVSMGNHIPIIRSNSKKFSNAPNPASGFIAIMTCSSADEGCPLVPGSATRISIPYDDPKLADGTPQQDLVYMERCKEIAIEMLYVFSRVRISW
ncbi:protein-tyrosine-phosphatase [Chitinophaga caeni]|uniref:Protein-tyrosine-phosphatase n=1 Tax=Chitinophaga caeni TaxID=2029983 RepID=A0A291QYW4_9BACT|nr:protein-tyrosine-phosphatase [Chitinophaga caeni]ATL49043.1 protein-tyrosine-phosphatase [Chitinophaga caeni]